VNAVRWILFGLAVVVVLIVLLAILAFAFIVIAKPY
jgi:hypothetical protein